MSGSLAIFAAMRRASSFGQALVADWRCDSSASNQRRFNSAMT
jgi:hypothetical protein